MSDKKNMITDLDFGRLMERVDSIAEHTKCLPVIKAELANVKGKAERNRLDIEKMASLASLADRVKRNEGEIEKIRTGAWKVVIIFLGAIVGSLFAGVSAHFK